MNCDNINNIINQSDFDCIGQVAKHCDLQKLCVAINEAQDFDLSELFCDFWNEILEINNELKAYEESQKLFTLPLSKTSPFAEKVREKVFRCEENAPGIKWFRLDFNHDEGSFHYENVQGEKVIRFGFGKNIFHKFPQTGYSDLIGSVTAPGNQYDAAFSADWPAQRMLRIRCQIIDKYFGNLAIVFGFRDENTVTVRMDKAAEDFLKEYTGIINAKAQ